MKPKPPLFPKLFVACARGALLAVLSLNLYYACGASGFSVRGKYFDFHREHDRQLFAIDDERAFLVTGDEHPSIAVVTYEPGLPLFRLCGKCVTKKSIFYWPHYRKGDWLYTDMPFLDGPAAYNLKTRELVRLKVERPESGKVDPEDVPFYAEHGFTFAEARRVDLEKVAEEYRPISTVNEMCTILEMAGFVVLAVVLSIGLVLLPFGLRKRRAA